MCFYFTLVVIYNIILVVVKSMRSILEVRKLMFDYNDKLLFNNLSFEISSGSFSTIFGINSSGKTTLAKLLIGQLDNNRTVLFDDFYVTSFNLKRIRRDVGFICENVCDSFISKTVSEEIALPLLNLNYSKDEILKKVNSIVYELKIRKLLSKKVDDIAYEDKWLVSLASVLIYAPKLLIIDGGFDCLSPLNKEKVLKTLKKYVEKGMTVVNLTSNIEECLYGEKIIMIDKKTALSFDNKEDFFSDLDFFEKRNIELPFIVTLTNKLKFYDLIHDTFFYDEDLVNYLWE